MNRLISVTRPTFDRAFGLLVANFGSYLDADDLRPIKALYLRTVEIVEAPDAQDRILLDAVDALVAHRNERGMPRLAEIREQITRILELDSLYRSEQQVRQTLVALHTAFMEDKAARRKTLGECVDQVAAILGQVQRQRALERQALQHKIDTHEVPG